MLFLQKRQKFWKKRFYVFIVFYAAVTLVAQIFAQTTEQLLPLSYVMIFSAWILPFLPGVFCRALRLPHLYLIDVIFDSFLLLAVTFASLLNGYTLIPYFDKVLHTIAGFLFAEGGMLFYYYLKPNHRIQKMDGARVSWAALLSSMALGQLWEIYEFTASLVSGGTYDPQLVKTTGVTDTMTDMIVCTLGGLVTALFCWRYYKTGKKDLMTKILLEFVEPAN
jgi:uncharacterized membrane protein YjdF